eukprot:340888-Rhodomonas_salina.2
MSVLHTESQARRQTGRRSIADVSTAHRIAAYAMSVPDSRMILCNVQYWDAMCGTGIAYGDLQQRAPRTPLCPMPGSSIRSLSTA